MPALLPMGPMSCLGLLTGLARGMLRRDLGQRGNVLRREERRSLYLPLSCCSPDREEDKETVIINKI